jgi:DNA-binding SARP family transcriptional activator/tetratricopeptide (TPR) repeat protein
MEFAVLGPLRVAVGGETVRVASARQRAVLALLLMSPNRTVTIPRLVDAVWGEHPAGSAHNLVHTYVWRLRTLLSDAGERRLLTESAGYVLRVEPGELDVVEFDRLVHEGRAALAQGEAAHAAGSLRAALGLWRGEPFADVTLYDDDQAAEVQRLVEARVAAWEERIEADLALGRHEALIGELRQFTLQHPLRERVAGQLMLACYRSGRKADALAAFGQIRTKLVEELGMDPGSELQDLHGKILRADPSLRATGRGGGKIVPRQLPATPAHFAGRINELRALSSLLDLAAEASAIAVISAIGGAAGIGKTTLAVRWAQQNLAQFPDGQLYVDLRGFAPSAQPMTAADAILGFLAALAIPADRIPQGLEAQASLYRSLLGGKRMLVVLDNARDTDQVRPLLPGSPTCLTLVTSRNPLTGLIAAEAAQPITLDLLTTFEARDLLASRLSPARVAAEPAAVAELIDLCARLPLALCIIAARATMEPALSISELVAGLHDVRHRLDALDIGDATTDVRAALTWSYRALPRQQARLFRLLALHTGPRISLAAIAALAAVSTQEARGLMDGLTEAHLAEQADDGRYLMHDLLRIFARESATTDEPAISLKAAIERVVVWYLHTASAAAARVRPGRRHTPLGPEPPGISQLSFKGYDDALEWLDAELLNCTAAADAAQRHGLDRIACAFPGALFDVFDLRGLVDEWAKVIQTALISARRLGDLSVQGTLLSNLAIVRARTARYEEALQLLDESLQIRRSVGDQSGEAATLGNISNILNELDRPDEALSVILAAAAIQRSKGDKLGEAMSLGNLGAIYERQGRHYETIRVDRRVLMLFRALGDRPGEARALSNLASANIKVGRIDQAIEYCRQALDASRACRARDVEALALRDLGRARHDQGDLIGARTCWEQALSIFDELGDPESARLAPALAALAEEEAALPVARPAIAGRRVTGILRGEQ